MPLLNYTTTIAPEQTVAEIQAKLSAAGARSVTVEYDGSGVPVALTFSMETAIGPAAYRLPAHLDGVFRVLTGQAELGLVRPSFVTRAHAARVGWRIIKDWTEAQLAIVEAGLAELDEVMLPYMLAPSGQTVYQVYTERRLALPPASTGG